MSVREQRPKLMEWDNYTMMRNGIREHMQRGRFSATDMAVYQTLLLWADWATGIYFGCAETICSAWGGQLKPKTVRDSLCRLRANLYINYREGDGQRGSYNILINKYQPTMGHMVGWELNAVTSTDFDNPVYMYVGNWSFVEAASEQYGDRLVTRLVEVPVHRLVNGVVREQVEEQVTATLLDFLDLKTGKKSKNPTVSGSSSSSEGKANSDEVDVVPAKQGLQAEPTCASEVLPISEAQHLSQGDEEDNDGEYVGCGTIGCSDPNCKDDCVPSRASMVAGFLASSLGFEERDGWFEEAKPLFSLRPEKSVWEWYALILWAYGREDAPFWRKVTRNMKAFVTHVRNGELVRQFEAAQRTPTFWSARYQMRPDGLLFPMTISNLQPLGRELPVMCAASALQANLDLGDCCDVKAAQEWLRRYAQRVQDDPAFGLTPISDLDDDLAIGDGEEDA
jgi:hypothetical protein